MLAAWIHLTDIDRGAWSSRRGEPHAYPPALERSLRSDPLEVSRSVSSVALLNLLANARL
jgi:hypothetical protein